jgi:hypothetical protein
VVMVMIQYGVERQLRLVVMESVATHQRIQLHLNPNTLLYVLGAVMYIRNTVNQQEYPPAVLAVRVYSNQNIFLSSN